MDPGVLDVAFSLGSKLLSEVCGVLVLDVLDDRVPATWSVRLCTRVRFNCGMWYIPAVVINLVAIAGGVDDVET